MTRRLLLSYLSITVLGLAILVIPLGRIFAASERAQLLTNVERDATVVAGYAEDALEAGTVPVLSPILDGYGGRGARVVVVNDAGLSVYDSEHPGAAPRDFSTRPEIIDALDGRRSGGTRFSKTLGHGLMYVVVPVASGGVVHGAVRITYPTSTVDDRIRETWLRLAGLSLAALIAVTGVGWLLARGVTKPVQEVRDAAIGLAGGDLDHRVPTDVGAPELRELAVTFNRTADALQEMVESQRRFVADASHQLRTPLTALRLRLENLEADLAPEAARELDPAIAETDRLAGLVDGLLALARSPTHETTTVTVELSDVIRRRVQLWNPWVTQMGATIEVTGIKETGIKETGIKETMVEVPDGTVEQILDNLISNALNAAGAGSRITIGIEVSPGGYELHVIDDGPGMTPAEMERAFDRFWRSPGNHGPGSGLGLAIVSDLATACGGHVALVDAEGGGLDVCVTLPGAELR